jgi:hypothetical protein
MADNIINFPGPAATAEQLAAFELEPFAAKDGAAMRHDFSADPWAAECAQHGVALRLVHVLLTSTKEKLVEVTDGMEKAFPPPDESPTAQLLETIRHTRKRFIELAGLLKTAEARQISAMAVVELRCLADGEALP